MALSLIGYIRLHLVISNYTEQKFGPPLQRFWQIFFFQRMLFFKCQKKLDSFGIQLYLEYTVLNIYST